MRSPQSNDARLSRRGVLGLIGAAGAALATGCQVDTGSGTSSGSGGASKGSNPKAIRFPDLKGKLPTGDVTFRWVDSGDLKSVWERSVLDAFTAKHANVRTQYDGNGWDNVNQVVPLGIRNKSAPDVFALPQDVPPQVAINEGWVRPIDDLIPDFDTWRSRFGSDVLVPGVSIFNDRVYSWPIASNRRLERMSIFDTAVMRAAGYDDPGKQIRTWDDLTVALTKVRKTGKVGLMAGGDGLGGIVGYLALTAGWTALPANGMDLRTGQYAYTADEFMAAYELFDKLVTDKLVVSGFVTMLEKDARAQMTAGKSGMIFNGPWDIPAWKKAAPQWKYDIASLPSQDGKPFLVPFLEGSNSSWVYAHTKIPTVVGQILSYMGSPEGQKMMVILSEGNLRSLQPEANKAADQPGLLDPKAKAAVALANAGMHVAPRPELRNPDVAKVNIALKVVTPNLTDVLQGLLTGQLSDPRKQFASLQSKLDAALDTAIATAKKKGSTVTRDDYAFGNWDPAKDYTGDDYKALK
ncbi:multiple sugar transport system substrate-binding protein [Actinopolymorpha cephalotaxi]|uniref:Multiple sugar transport system substrate-binding protein n=1 Tax=Actinopolymorpha cephalotaxi TaxID=504797 RepID=A0A1I2ZV59_9ACTN|nr:ABC transporter substrate-binding protein [Actinopolymorpha cephalotaxi]NYH84186.1 multiple sugar transport system substrate-binding protein [Actinopolymorpha cephalotaxi]SFH41684.1 multiple sugar transport system substrate-binding protein [Actinopolymorpha cephalotaxi]